MSDTNVDNQETNDYNTSGEEDTVESLQQKYTEALTSGDSAAIQAAEEANEKFLGKTKGSVPPPTASEEKTTEATVSETAPAKTVEDTSKGAKESTQVGLVAKDGEGLPEKEVSGETQEWLDSLSPAARLKVEEVLKAKEYLEGWKRSTEGRLNAFQKVNAEKEQLRLENLRLKQSSTKPTPSVPSSAPTAAKTITNKQLEELKKTDPEMASVLEAEREIWRQEQEEQRNKLASYESELQRLKELTEQGYQKSQEFEQTTKIERELTRLEQAWPGSRQAMGFTLDLPDGNRKSPWLEFIDTLPPGARSLAGSESADDYAMLMPHYLNFLPGWAAAHGIPLSQPEPTPQATATTTTVDPRAQQIAADRQRRLNTSPVQQGTPTTPIKAKPTQAEILADPALLKKEQLRLIEEEYKAAGLPFNPKDFE